MSYDGVLSVYNSRIIPALVEHSHIYAQNIGKVYCALHGPLIRTDDHQMFIIDLKVINRCYHGFQKLIRRHEVVKSGQRDSILHTRIMGVKSNDIGDTHLYQLLKGQGTVQRFSFCSFVLTALIKKRHDHIDPVGFSGGSSNDPFEILIMVIRRHMVGMTADLVCQAVVAYIYHNKHIRSPDRFTDNAFGFSGAKAWTVTVDEKALLRIPPEIQT